MKVLFTALILLNYCLLTGCNNMASFSSHETTVNAYAPTCCNDVNAQSGYYYNGYKENGWRYCVVPAK